MDVAINAEKGPIDSARIIFKGKIRRFRINIPSGGIHIFLKIDCIFVVPSHTYWTQALHNNVSVNEIPGRRIQPRNEKDQSIKDGNENIRPNVIKVRITACTIPKVCCMA